MLFSYITRNLHLLDWFHTFKKVFVGHVLVTYIYVVNNDLMEAKRSCFACFILDQVITVIVKTKQVWMNVKQDHKRLWYKPKLYVSLVIFEVNVLRCDGVQRIGTNGRGFQLVFRKIRVMFSKFSFPKLVKVIDNELFENS